MRVRPWLFTAGLVACGGGSGDELRFNSDDQVTVAIVAGSETGDDVATDLHSTTGSVTVGTGTVSPGSGPVGTVHTVTIRVADDYVDSISSAGVITDAGDRGVEEVSLVQDSADHGLWWREVTSVGVEGEERTDTFTFALYTPAPDTDTNGILPNGILQ